MPRNYAETSAAMYYESATYNVNYTDTFWPDITGVPSSEVRIIDTLSITSIAATNLTVNVMISDNGYNNYGYVFHGIIPAKTSVVIVSRDSPLILTDARAIRMWYQEYTQGGGTLLTAVISYKRLL